ncbi:hypothetical protein EGW08_012827 [Elysia chlorotica]|uniref:SID1 transmembrane family member 1 n=1 Tax=Elysia chlorotica TaxID=188477 RepID=A0A433TD98_ELYCH|nr:hypothetical protein EGW08_012827 [Elysia chlorotica]
MEYASRLLWSQQMKFVLLLTLTTATLLGSTEVSVNDGLSQDSSAINLSLPRTRLVSQFHDATINGFSVKMESFELKEPESLLLYDTGLISAAPESETVSTVVVQNASFDQLYIGEVSAKTQYMFVFNYTEGDKTTAMRIQLFSGRADKNYPIMCVARQQEGILSWQLPLEVESSYSYWSSSRTLCPVDKNHKEQMEKEQLIYVTISSMSREKKDFNLTTFKIDDFQVEHDVPKNFEVSVARPKYYMYYFPEGIDHVMLKVTSKSEMCMTVSIQSIKCPVFDLEMNIEYDGKYQTMSTQATMLLQRDDYADTNGFYIVFITKANDKDCVGHLDFQELVPSSKVGKERRKNISIIITDTITNAQYWKATSAALGFFLAFYLLAFVLFCLCQRCGLPKTFAEMSSEDMGNDDEFLRATPHGASYGATGNGNLEDSASTSRQLSAVSSSSGVIDESAIDFLPDADYEKDVFRTKTALFVSDLARKKRSKLAKIYKTFYWNLLTIAIFYGLPVVQLVITYQRVLNESGNLDLCYYNFGCAHPWRDYLSAFNNVYSNIGYIMLGLLFIIIVRVR